MTINGIEINHEEGRDTAIMTLCERWMQDGVESTLETVRGNIATQLGEAITANVYRLLRMMAKDDKPLDDFPTRERMLVEVWHRLELGSNEALITRALNGILTPEALEKVLASVKE